MPLPRPITTSSSLTTIRGRECRDRSSAVSPGDRARERHDLGYARANNIGVRSTDGELVLLLNSDTIVPPGAIDQLVARLRDADSTAVIGPRPDRRGGRPELSFGKMMSPFNELMQKLKAVALRSNLRCFPGGCATR